MRKVSSASLTFWIIIVLVSPYVITNIEFFEQFESTGTIGDTIGGIMNPLVTIIAVWLTYKAFLIQYEANENQKEAFQQQQLDLRIQRFENIFFEQVNIFQNLVKDLYFSNKTHLLSLKPTLTPELCHDVKIYGHEVFKWLYEEVEYPGLVDEKGKEFFPWLKGVRDLFEKLSDNSKIYEQNITISVLDHYFRFLYRIFKYIYENRELLNRDGFKNGEYKYASIVRSLLSEYELVFLFYNCLSEFGRDKFKFYVERYALLKNIRFELLVKKEEERAKYRESAYKMQEPIDVK